MLDLDQDQDHQTDHPPSPATASPRTPVRSPQDKPHNLYYQNGTTTPSFSPLASLSMSLPSPGMSPFTPSRRQTSPPFMSSSPSPSPRPGTAHSSQDDFMPSSRLVLIQRLTDLAMKLNQEHYEEDEKFNKLHTMVDRMESVFADHSQQRHIELGNTEDPKSFLGEESSDGADWESRTPEQAMHDMSDPISPVNPPPPLQEPHGTRDVETQTRPDTQISRADAERIVAEAQDLCKALEDVITNLRARQEESDHIHDLLIMRAERAAQHIMYLEKRVQELENERNENEMEILNLQFQLKAIEVQCLSYVPKDADQDLRESISAWKNEWSALKRKRARKKEAHTDADADTAASGSPKNHARTVGSPGPARTTPKITRQHQRLSLSPNARAS